MILYVSPYFYPSVSFGGPATSLYELAKTMTEKGADVTVLTTDVSGSGKRLTVFPKQKFKVVYAASLFPKLAWNSKLFLSVDQLLKSFSLVKKARVVHFQDLFIINHFLISLLCRAYNKPYIITPHASLTLNKLRGKVVVKKLFWFLFIKNFVSGAKEIVAVSETEKKEIEKEFAFLKSKVIYIPNIVKINTKIAKYNWRKALGLKEDDKIILFLGRILRMKGVFELLDGFKEYLKGIEAKNAHLVIAGPDMGGLAKLKRRTGKYGLKANVHFVGVVQGSKRDSLLLQSDCLSLLSYSEGLPTVILEAAACARPVVFTKECNVDVFAKMGGGILTTRNEKRVSQVFTKLFATNEITSTMGKKAKICFRKYFSGREIVAKYKKLYNDKY